MDSSKKPLEQLLSIDDLSIPLNGFESEATIGVRRGGS